VCASTAPGTNPILFVELAGPGDPILYGASRLELRLHLVLPMIARFPLANPGLCTGGKGR
jgi:hypothetical protein